MIAYSNKQTCGVFCGSQINEINTVTCIVIPNQQGNRSSCLMMNEEEISKYQEQENLITM